MTNVEFIRRVIENQINLGSIGRVTSVFVNDGTGETSNYEVNVALVNNEQEFRRIPVHATRTGHISVPQVGDVVEVGFLNSGTQAPYVSGFIYTNTTRPPLGKEGHWRHRFGSDSPYLFIEAEKSDHTAGDPDVVRIGKKEDGLSDPTTTVEVDDSGSTTEVTIDCEGDVTINADGVVKLGDSSGTYEPVARKGDSVEVSDPDSGTLSGEITSGSSDTEST